MIHKGDGTIRRFIKSDRGLFYLDVPKNRKREIGSEDTALLNTLANNQSKYTSDTGAEAGVGSRAHGLRPRRAPNYSRHMHGPSTSKKTGYTLAHLQQLEHVVMAQHAASEGVRNLLKLEHIALTQYSVKKGLKVYGEEGTQAVISGMKQL